MKKHNKYNDSEIEIIASLLGRMDLSEIKNLKLNDEDLKKVTKLYFSKYAKIEA